MRVTAGEVHQFEDGEGWFHLPGAPEGVTVRIMANSLDPTTRQGARVQMLRLPPSTSLPEAPPAAGDYWRCCAARRRSRARPRRSVPLPQSRSRTAPASRR